MSCVDAPPKKFQTVLVYTPKFEEFTVAKYMGDMTYRWHVDKYGKSFYCQPSHWMILPERPVN
ncbi:DUF551 domain-containing protein [Ewingella sp. CoE-038-23]